MSSLRKAHERGKSETAWLTSHHSFSFANYYDPKYLHFSHLRVINEDMIAPKSGFPLHPHQNMEILTYVRQGRVAHQDSMGNQTQVQAGEFQIMSAGTGIYHAEFNPSDNEPLHLYQIWILPQQKNITPRYEQGQFADQVGGTLILSPQPQGQALQVYQDMQLWRYQYPANHAPVRLELNAKRRYWLQMIKGELHHTELRLNAGDGLAIRQQSHLALTPLSDCEFLLFDLL
ncbi:pirin family protein [Volucribacter amazonae]|uniref:Quercetin 2,3-dioxygenase n=1 Tax=Volucribacter amazonae TaxID=256731 RepID=A0A9X4PHY8_9PAST|nr:pirin family protein [Volucribacter amazonae]MDG6895540.1 quercetin 2,3-dioxygenase [Volucribacter amazonae]